jgi:hypothetical protein
MNWKRIFSERRLVYFLALKRIQPLPAVSKLISKIKKEGALKIKRQ